MNDEDWENMNKEWEGSFGYKPTPNRTRRASQSKFQGKYKAATRHKFEEILNRTPLAMFFCTKITDEGKEGFWVPRKAIRELKDSSVDVFNWCTLSKIKYYEDW